MMTIFSLYCYLFACLQIKGNAVMNKQPNTVEHLDAELMVQHC